MTVREFVEAEPEFLGGLKVLDCEKYLNRKIHETAINRPGLALTGFFKYFAHKRLQVLGLAENTFLESLSPDERDQRLAAMCARQIPGIVLTRKRRPKKQLLEQVRRHRVPLLGSSLITGDFINRATLVLERLTAPTQSIYGTMVDIHGTGVLIEGDPGMGKSETALALMLRGHSLVSDDHTELTRNSRGEIIGHAPKETQYYMEIRGLGIVHVPSLFTVNSVRESHRLDLIVKLVTLDSGVELDRTGLNPQFRDVMGVQLPFISLPVAPGRDMAHVIEVAAMNQTLKNMGIDAAQEFDHRLRTRLTGRRKT